MNIKCMECGATIFTPSSNKEEHDRLLAGHMKAIHGDERSRMVALLSKSMAVLQLIHAHGGVEKVFTKFQAKDLINEISDVLKVPRTNTEVPPAPPKVAVAPPVDAAATTRLAQSTTTTPEKAAALSRRTVRVVTQAKKD